jgi:general secretion pathway protein I
MRCPVAHTPRSPRTRRAGLSLIEVLVSLAIFLISLVALGQLVQIGTDRAIDVQERSQASTYCRSALAQVTAGIVPITGQGMTAFDDDPNWSWSVDSEADGTPNLYHVTITVSRQRPDGTQTQFTLNQWMLDPASRGSAASTPPPTADDTSSSGTNTGSSSGSSPSTNTGKTTPQPQPQPKQPQPKQPQPRQPQPQPKQPQPQPQPRQPQPQPKQPRPTP